MQSERIGVGGLTVRVLAMCWGVSVPLVYNRLETLFRGATCHTHQDSHCQPLTTGHTTGTHNLYIPTDHFELALSSDLIRLSSRSLSLSYLLALSSFSISSTSSLLSLFLYISGYELYQNANGFIWLILHEMQIV